MKYIIEKVEAGRVPMGTVLVHAHWFEVVESDDYIDHQFEDWVFEAYHLAPIECFEGIYSKLLEHGESMPLSTGETVHNIQGTAIIMDSYEPYEEEDVWKAYNEKYDI